MGMQTTKWFVYQEKALFLSLAIFYLKIEENEGKPEHFFVRKIFIFSKISF